MEILQPAKTPTQTEIRCKTIIMEPKMDAKARRAAKRVELRAHKSRWRKDTFDNFGAFQVVDPYTNTVVAGVRYDMSPEDVIEYCKPE
jgi:hypothetical protein